jgi:PhnB protein
MPMEGMQLSNSDQNKILHIALPFGKDMLMACDMIDSMGQKVVQGNNSHISIHAESKNEANRIFNALSAGGTVGMPIADQPWGDYYGHCRDKYGTNWMVSYTYPREK